MNTVCLHYLKCMLVYFKTILYKKGESYYIDEKVDKAFSFSDWLEKLSDEEIMKLCDYDKNITAKDIRETLKISIKKWVSNNCEGELV